MYTKSYSKKQAGVIYAAAKRGDIKMTRDGISFMYDNADGIEIYDNRTAELAKCLPYSVRNAIDAIFANDYELAQVSIDVINELAA